MNREFDRDPGELSLDDSLLDRLVDGELSDQERRQALTTIQRQEDGWRRCATAFLEAQAWGQEFQTLCQQRDTAPSAKPQAANRSARSHSWAMWLSLATCLPLAFGLGLLAGSQPEPSIEGPALLVENDAPTPADVQPSLVQKPAISPSGVMTLVVGYGNQAEEIELPVYDIQQFDPRWLDSPALPDDVALALEKSGHRIRRSQQFWPIEVQQGQHVIVPVEQIDFEPARKLYQ